MLAVIDLDIRFSRPASPSEIRTIMSVYLRLLPYISSIINVSLQPSDSIPAFNLRVGVNIPSELQIKFSFPSHLRLSLVSKELSTFLISSFSVLLFYHHWIMARFQNSSTFHFSMERYAKKGNSSYSSSVLNWQIVPLNKIKVINDDL